MPYSKSQSNTYASNNSVSYNKSAIHPVQRFYTNNNPDALPNKNNKKEFTHLLTGGNTAGNVWINSGYDVAREDPGISWTL